MLYIVESKLRYEHLDIVFIEVFHKVTHMLKKKKKSIHCPRNYIHGYCNIYLGRLNFCETYPSKLKAIVDKVLNKWHGNYFYVDYKGQ